MSDSKSFEEVGPFVTRSPSVHLTFARGMAARSAEEFLESTHRDHEACVNLVQSSFAGLPVGGGQCHAMAGGPSSQDTCMVYGELTFDGMGKLHDALKLQGSDALYDLGSGVGKFVLYAALRNACASATGVEVGLKRHASAERACTKLEGLLQREDGPHRCAAFGSVLGDIKEPIYGDATVIVVCNIMFGALLNSGILSNLLHRCPRVKKVASIVQIHHPRFVKLRTVSVPCTWSRHGVSWSIYDVLPSVPHTRTQRHDIHARAKLPTPWVRPSLLDVPPLRPLSTGGIKLRGNPTTSVWHQLATYSACQRQRQQLARASFDRPRPTSRPASNLANLAMYERSTHGFTRRPLPSLAKTS
jgi:hypothetical protein